ncbi:MAG: hypothetical protein PHH70_00670 [Candidatus Gracilibacteria bacterium]|nr:hypothetical protein [Candidatus Gracilibacteria bacterium]
MGLNAPTGWTEDDHNKFMAETQDIQDELDSDVIDSRMPYSKQAATVKQCLVEAFGEYATDIRLVNRFFFELEFFMKRMKDLKEYTGPKEGGAYDEVMEGAISGGNTVKFNLVSYGSKADDRMEEDLRKQGKNEEEVTKLTKARYDRFLSLLRERIQYEQK